MDAGKVVVIVEDMDISRTALKWALHNLVRYGDLITLLHVLPISRSRNKKKIRLLRLKGYQLALSFKEICNSFPNGCVYILQSKTEIVVTEGDQEGGKIADLVREIGASTLVVGLHDRSFLYRLAAVSHRNIETILNCKILALKQPTVPLMTARRTTTTISIADSSPSMDFSQIEIAGLSFPDIPPPKIPYRICPNPSAIIWRRSARRRRRKRTS